MKSAMGTVADPAGFGKVAVVMGGWSAEREVSLMSGEQVLEALVSLGINAHAVDAERDVAQALLRDEFNRAFLILHGRGGEDGTVQAALELASIPYTGSGVLGSALSMDKQRSKELVSLHGVPVAKGQVVTTLDEAVAVVNEIGLPVVVKPVLEGSSIGVSMVSEDRALPTAFAEARRFGAVLIEERLPGREVTASILHGTALPLVSMQGRGEFYDYEAKYLADDTVYECPVSVDDSVAEAIRIHALAAFDALACRGWGRVDFMLDAQGQPRFIECNTAPGMTSHSLVPMAAQAAGMDFGELCVEILRTSLAEGSVVS